MATVEELETELATLNEELKKEQEILLQLQEKPIKHTILFGKALWNDPEDAARTLRIIQANETGFKYKIKPYRTLDRTDEQKKEDKKEDEKEREITWESLKAKISSPNFLDIGLTSDAIAELQKKPVSEWNNDIQNIQKLEPIISEIALGKGETIAVGELRSRTFADKLKIYDASNLNILDIPERVTDEDIKSVDKSAAPYLRVIKNIESNLYPVEDQQKKIKNLEEKIENLTALIEESIRQQEAEKQELVIEPTSSQLAPLDNAHQNKDDPELQPRPSSEESAVVDSGVQPQAHAEEQIASPKLYRPYQEFLTKKNDPKKEEKLALAKADRFIFDNKEEAKAYYTEQAANQTPYFMQRFKGGEPQEEFVLSLGAPDRTLYQGSRSEILEQLKTKSKDSGMDSNLNNLVESKIKEIENSILKQPHSKTNKASPPEEEIDLRSGVSPSSH